MMLNLVDYAVIVGIFEKKEENCGWCQFMQYSLSQCEHYIDQEM